MDTFVSTIGHRLAQIGSGGFELLVQAYASIVEARAMKARFETEAYRSRYHLTSKNDDDLPIVR